MYTRITLIVDEGILGAINKVSIFQEGPHAFLSIISADFQPISKEMLNKSEIQNTSSLAALGISTKVINCLMLSRKEIDGKLTLAPEMRVSTVEELCDKSEKDLTQYAGIGPSSIREIKTKLAQFGLSLKQ